MNGVWFFSSMVLHQHSLKWKLRPFSISSGWTQPHSTLQRFSSSSSHGPQHQGGTGILLMNMGGPGHLDEVYPFLHRLFSDQDIIQLPFQRHVAPLLAKRRTPKIQGQYASIGGKSPIRMWTEKQGHLLTTLLDQMSPETAPHRPFIGFRYAHPLTEEAIQEMKKQGIRRAVAFSQYPQYSCATTGSSLNELHRQLTLLDPEKSITWSVLDRWPTHPGFVQVPIFID
ncbi:ferrochelatase hem15 [Coelomomyces lativittatus]|nr:ferrochelatase hem15 [Coelomomyces lativittatus]